MRDGVVRRRHGRWSALSSPACLLSVLLTAALVLLAANAPASLAQASTRPAATPSAASRVIAPAVSEIVVALRGLTPTVARTGTPVQVRVEVTNKSTEAASAIDLRLRLGRTPLVTRSELDTWEADTAGESATLPVVSEQHLAGGIPAGGTARAMLTIASPTLPSRAFGTLPLAIEVRSASGSSWSRTYLPFFVKKQFVPLSVAFAIPLTLDPDPNLVSTTATDRDRAWTKAIGAGSRIDRLLTGGASALVTWAVDPALVGAAPSIASSDGSTSTSTGSGTPTVGPTTSGPTTSGPSSPSSSPSTTSAASSSTPGPSRPTPRSSPSTAAPSTTARVLQSALADRLTQSGLSHPLWRLPTGDPDLLGLFNAKATTALTGALVGTDDLGTRLGGPVNPVVWPVGGGLTEEQARAVDAGYGGNAHPTAYLAPLTTLGDNPASITTAPRRTSGGLPVLAYDDRLSALFGASIAVRDAARATSRFLAETAVVLEQQPGRSRSVLVVAPRSFSPEPAALSGLLSAVASAPWLSVTSTAALESEAMTTSLTVPSQPTSGQPTPSATAMAPGAQVGAPTPGSASTPSPGTSTATAPTTLPGTPSAMGPADVAAVESSLGQLDGLATATSTGASFLTTARSRVLALTSVRWRGAIRERAAVVRSVADQLAGLRSSVHVVESTVNFFADTGILQVTVVNSLPVEVHDITLRLNPDDRVSRLRILEQPAALRIRAGSRTTVRVPVEAIAAGLVPVSTRLQTPAGTTLGTDGTVRVQVQPTNGWVVLALGGVALVVFLAGLYRALRAGRPRISSSELKEIDLS